MAKNNKIWIIIAVIIIIAMGMGGKKEAAIGQYYWSFNNNECRIYTSFDGTGYLSEPAPQYTNQADCLAANNGNLIGDCNVEGDKGCNTDSTGIIATKCINGKWTKIKNCPSGCYLGECIVELNGKISGITSTYQLGESAIFDIIATGGVRPCNADITIVKPTKDPIITNSQLTGTCVGSPCRHINIITDDIGLWEMHIVFSCSDGNSDITSTSFIVKEKSSTCTDTDGQDFKTRGSVTYDTGGVLGPATVYDVCLNDGITLIEQTCLNGAAKKITKNCKDFGSDWSCESLQLKGACVKNIAVSYTYQCTGADGEIGYTASTGGGLINVGTCGVGKECASLFKNSNTILRLEEARNLICKFKNCVADNSCAANTCIGTPCTNNCGTSVPGTKACGTTTTTTTIPSTTTTTTIPPPTTCTKNSDCPAGKECNSKGRCVSECLPLLQVWDKEEGECGVSSIVIIIGIFLAIMIALKMMSKK